MFIQKKGIYTLVIMMFLLLTGAVVMYSTPKVMASGEIYPFSTGFSDTQGQNQWYYEQWDGTSYSNMTWQANHNRWAGAQANCFIDITGASPCSNDAVITWKAPRDGKITITGTMEHIDPTNGDGVQTLIKKQSGATVSQIWPSSGWQIIDPGFNSRHVLTVTVAQDDIIYFHLNKRSDHTYDTTKWDPVIQYDAIPAFTTDKAEVVMSPTDLNNMQINNFVDSSLSYVKRTDGSYWWHSESKDEKMSHFKGPLEAPGTTLIYHEEGSDVWKNPNNLDGWWSWWINNIYEDEDGGLLAFCHLEDPRISESRYYRIGLAYSADDGLTWNKLGFIVAQNIEERDHNILGVPYFIKDGYFYIYFNDFDGSKNVRGGARAPVSEVLAAAKEGEVTNWYKYYDGSWNEPGLNGNVTNLIPNGPDVTKELLMSSDAAYSSTQNKYIITSYYNGTGKGVYLSFSDDGVNWGNQIPLQKAISADGLTLSPYITIINADGTDNGVVGDEFYVYWAFAPEYASKKNGNLRWIYRQKVTLTKTHYQASQDFSTEQGQNQWYYQGKDSNGVYTDLIWDSMSTRWQGSYPFLVVKSNQQHPHTNESVRKWAAPYDGQINISSVGNVRKTDNNGDGVIGKVYHNNTLLWSQTITDTTGVSFPSIDRTVAAGDAIYFIVNQNGTVSYDTTVWDPLIEYPTSPATPVPVPTPAPTEPKKLFESLLNFSSEQGNKQWYYQEKDGSGVYTDLIWNSNKSWWQGSHTFLIAKSDQQHPDTNESVKKWVAPYDGQIKINSVGNVRKTSNSGDGVIAKVYHNSTLLWSQTITNTTGVSFPTIDRTVTAGDAIYFIVNQNGTVSYDTTVWDPQIEYPKAVYQASSDFRIVQGLNQWYYQEKDSSGVYTDLAWDSTTSRWQGSYAFLVVQSDRQHPHTNESVRKWVAPVDGKIRVNSVGNVRKKDDIGDGVIAKVYHNNTLLWSQTITDTTGVSFPSMDRTVTAGDAIYFIVNQNGTTQNDMTLWDPRIEYPKSAYHALADYGTGQGINQWYYQEKDSNGTYTDLTWDSDNVRWAGSDPYLTLNKDMQHPGTNESVRKWVAPVGGQITINSVGNVRKYDNAGDGVIGKVYHNGTLLWSQTVTDTTGVSFPSTVRTVAEGDAIYFIVNPNGTNSYDQTLWDPLITY